MNREELLAQWLDLTKRQLPAQAAGHAWPVHADHCFMRICLDATFGRPWREAIDAPAIRHISDGDLARAVAIARRIVDDPAILPELNRASLRLRQKGAFS
jgi:hypothetical protein